MRNIKKNLKIEDGQAILEFALVAPIFIILIMFIIDCAWIGFQRISFDYAYRESSWEMKLNDYYVKNDFNYEDFDIGKDFLDKMIEKAPQLDKKGIEVDNSSSVYYSTRMVVINSPNSTGGSDLCYENRRYADICSYVTYRIKMLTPVGNMFFGKYNEIYLSSSKRRLVRSSLVSR